MNCVGSFTNLNIFTGYFYLKGKGKTKKEEGGQVFVPFFVKKEITHFSMEIIGDESNYFQPC